MATALFIFLRWAKELNSDYDLYVLCLLLALDSQALLRWWIWKRGV